VEVSIYNVQRDIISHPEFFGFFCKARSANELLVLRHGEVFSLYRFMSLKSTPCSKWRGNICYSNYL